MGVRRCGGLLHHGRERAIGGGPCRARVGGESITQDIRERIKQGRTHEIVVGVLHTVGRVPAAKCLNGRHQLIEMIETPHHHGEGLGELSPCAGMSVLVNRARSSGSR